jgi:hypothetical protein
MNMAEYVSELKNELPRFNPSRYQKKISFKIYLKGLGIRPGRSHGLARYQSDLIISVQFRS